MQTGDVTIRIMDAADYDAVYALWISTPGMGLSSLDDSREGIARFLARNPACCFVALSGGVLVGVILCGHDGRRGHIYHMAVANDYRKRGIGRALLDHTLNALRAEGINKASLYVFTNNHMGNAFWESVGFAARDDLTIRGMILNDMNKAEVIPQ